MKYTYTIIFSTIYRRKEHTKTTPYIASNLYLNNINSLRRDSVIQLHNLSVSLRILRLSYYMDVWIEGVFTCLCECRLNLG